MQGSVKFFQVKPWPSQSNMQGTTCLQVCTTCIIYEEYNGTVIISQYHSMHVGKWSEVLLVVNIKTVVL